MEFGLFLQGYVPGPGAHDPDREHEAFLREAELVGARRPHQLEVRLVLRAPRADRVQPPLVERGDDGLPRARHRAHPPRLGHLQPQPPRQPPGAQRRAGRDARPPVRGALRVGHGPRRRLARGRHVQHPRHSSTKREWDEVIREIPRMWETEEYTFQGEHFQVDKPHNILPKPYRDVHPPIWVACGNPPTFGKAGRLGIGALGFNFSPIHDMRPDDRVVQEGHRRVRGADRPLRQRQRDGHQRGALLRGRRARP